MIAPDWFVRELHAFDPDLRLRWSRRLEMWQLERKVRRSLHPGTILCDDYRDDWIRAKDGFLLVASIPPKSLSRSIFARLKDADLWSNGGWQKIANAMDEADAMEEQRRLGAFQARIKEYSRDVYDLIKVRDGRTVFNSGWIQ